MNFKDFSYDWYKIEYNGCVKIMISTLFRSNYKTHFLENTFPRWMNFHGYESCLRSELKSIASFIKPYKEIICIVSWGTTPRLFIYVYLLSDVIRRSYFDARPVKCDTGRWCSV